MSMIGYSDRIARLKQLIANLEEEFNSLVIENGSHYKIRVNEIEFSNNGENGIISFTGNTFGFDHNISGDIEISADNFNVKWVNSDIIEGEDPFIESNSAITFRGPESEEPVTLQYVTNMPLIQDPTPNVEQPEESNATGLFINGDVIVNAGYGPVADVWPQSIGNVFQEVWDETGVSKIGKAEEAIAGVEAQIQTMETTITGITSAVETAQTTAEGAQSAAESAQATANTASALAETAQAEAVAAQAAAEAADATAAGATAGAAAAASLAGTAIAASASNKGDIADNKKAIQDNKGHIDDHHKNIGDLKDEMSGVQELGQNNRDDIHWLSDWIIGSLPDKTKTPNSKNRQDLDLATSLQEVSGHQLRVKGRLHVEPADDGDYSGELGAEIEVDGDLKVKGDGYIKDVKIATIDDIDTHPKTNYFSYNDETGELELATQLKTSEYILCTATLDPADDSQTLTTTAWVNAIKTVLQGRLDAIELKTDLITYDDTGLIAELDFDKADINTITIKTRLTVNGVTEINNTSTFSGDATFSGAVAMPDLTLDGDSLITRLANIEQKTNLITYDVQSGTPELDFDTIDVNVLQVVNVGAELRIQGTLNVNQGVLNVNGDATFTAGVIFSGTVAMPDLTLNGDSLNTILNGIASEINTIITSVNSHTEDISTINNNLTTINSEIDAIDIRVTNNENAIALFEEGNLLELLEDDGIFITANRLNEEFHEVSNDSSEYIYWMEDVGFLPPNTFPLDPSTDPDILTTTTPYREFIYSNDLDTEQTIASFTLYDFTRKNVTLTTGLWFYFKLDPITYRLMLFKEVTTTASFFFTVYKDGVQFGVPTPTFEITRTFTLNSDFQCETQQFIGDYEAIFSPDQYEEGPVLYTVKATITYNTTYRWRGVDIDDEWDLSLNLDPSMVTTYYHWNHTGNQFQTNIFRVDPFLSKVLPFATSELDTELDAHHQFDGNTGELQAPVLRSQFALTNDAIIEKLEVNKLYIPTIFADIEWPHIHRLSRKPWQRLQLANTGNIEHAIQLHAGTGMASIGSDPGFDFKNDEEWQEGDCIEISLLRAREHDRFKVNLFVWNDIIEDYYPDGSPEMVTALASLPVFVAKNFGNSRGFTSDWRVVVPGEYYEYQLQETYYRFRVWKFQIKDQMITTAKSQTSYVPAQSNNYYQNTDGTNKYCIAIVPEAESFR